MVSQGFSMQPKTDDFGTSPRGTRYPSAVFVILPRVGAALLRTSGVWVLLSCQNGSAVGTLQAQEPDATTAEAHTTPAGSSDAAAPTTDSSMGLPPGDAAVGTSASEQPSGSPAPAFSCTDTSYDHDQDPTTECRAMTICAAGQYVVSGGTKVQDRVCAECLPATFSSASNAAACTPWTVCSWAQVETQSPSSSTDRSCAPGSAYRLLPDGPVAISIAIDSTDSLLVGFSDGLVRRYSSNGVAANEIGNGSFGNSTAVVAVDSRDDVLISTAIEPGGTRFLSKYDRDGYPQWTTPVFDTVGDRLEPTFIAVDAADNVVVAGTHQLNPFVIKYDRDGNELWRDRFDPGPVAFARSVAVDRQGNVLVSGSALGKLPGLAEGVDGYLFLRKYDPHGRRLWLDQFGNEQGFEEGFALAVDGQGNAIAGGYTLHQVEGITDRAILRKYDPEGAPLWTEQFAVDHVFPGVRALAVDAADNVLVALNSTTLDGSSSAGIVVRSYAPDGGQLTSHFEAPDAAPEGPHAAGGIAVDSGGRVFVVGSAFEPSSNKLPTSFIWLASEP